MSALFLLLSIWLCSVLCDDCPQCKDCHNCTSSGKQCGWCPTKGECLSGDEYGPSNTTCIANAEQGQWIWARENCQCLEATTCTDIAGTSGGWCPYHQHCYLGDRYGPYDNITCPATAEQGQWIWGDVTNSCKCLYAKTCYDISGTPGGWCPSYNRCYLGDKNGPYDNITCPATISQGQWIWGTSNCAILTASNCVECHTKIADSSWCPYHGKCYFGDFNGPKGGINCPSDIIHGQYIYHADDCGVLDSSSTGICESCLTVSTEICHDCGWCINVNNIGINKCLIGDSKSRAPWYGLTCNEWITSSKQCNATKCPYNCDKSKIPICDTTGYCTSCINGYSGPYCDVNDAVCEQCKIIQTQLIQKLTKVECNDIAEAAIEFCLAAGIEFGPLDPFICAGVGAAAYISCEKGEDIAVGCTVCAAVCAECGQDGIQNDINIHDEKMNAHDIENMNYSVPSYPYFPSTFTFNGTMKTSNASNGKFYMILSVDPSSNIIATNISNAYGTVEYLQLNHSRYHSWCNATQCGCQYTFGAQNVSIYDYLPILMNHLNTSTTLQLLNINDINDTEHIVHWNANVVKNMSIDYYEMIIGTNVSDPKAERYPIEINLINDTSTNYLASYSIDMFVNSIMDEWDLLNPKSIQNCTKAPNSIY